jgi:putative ABC transport system permease protein
MPLVVTLAFRNLFQDRVRLIVTLIGIVFSVVLVSVQLGLFFGFQRMVTTMIDQAHVDLWITPPETRGFEATAAILDGRERFRALPIDGVADVTPVMVGFSYWRKPTGSGSTPVIVVGVQTGSEGLQPWNVIEGSRDDLSAPDAVAVDRSYFERLGVTRLGEYGEISGRKARVAVVTKGIRSFTTTPFVFTSLDRARTFLGAPASAASYFMVRIAAGADVEAIRRRLAAELSDAEVLTSDEFRRRSRSFWLFGTGAGAALFGSALLGIIVGTVIVAQTLYASTKDHLVEFATLRAIGSSRRYIHAVILCQALLSAAVGFSIAAVLGLLIAAASAETALPIVMNARLLASLFVLTVGMSVASAMSAIVVVTRVDPAMVFSR